MTISNAGTVYIETSVVSYLTARAPRELLAAAWQAATIDLWDEHRSRYQLFTSELTRQEASRGDATAAAKRLAALEGIRTLPYTDAVESLVDILIENNAVPEGSRNDAVHIAEAAVHSIDFLLTWNFRHLANAGAQRLIRTLCEGAGYSSPEVCTPFAMMGLMGEIDDG